MLRAAVPVDADSPRSRRFAVRRRPDGALEVFDVKWTRDVDGEPEFHGHPASRVDRAVLRVWFEQGLITAAELRRLSRELPGC